MAVCFQCRQPVQPDQDLVLGPLCGPKEEHPDCSDVPWHAEHRQEWLAELAGWADVFSYDPSDEPDTAAP